MINSSNTNDRIFSALATLVAAALIVLFLYLGNVGGGRSQLAEASIPEEDPDTEDIFIDPQPPELKELIEATDENPAEKASDEAEAPAPGLPEPAPEEQPKKIVPGDNPEPAPKTEKLITQSKPSPVQATNPPKEDRPESKVKSAMADKFSPKNGSPDGKEGAAGTAGASSVGRLNGRTFMGCTLPKVKLKQKVTVVVAVVVDASGRVIEASYRSGAAESYIREACVRSARTARWSEKPGASAEKGTITFTIIPRI